MINQKGLAQILLLGFIAAALIAGLSFGYVKYVKNDNANLNTNEPVFCTQEAKLCPDGSYVGRTGPNCEFAECPGENENTNANLNTNVNLNTNFSTDETAGWQTYSNATFKYTIKYPGNWFSKSCGDDWTAFVSDETRLPPCETLSWGDIVINIQQGRSSADYQEDINLRKTYLNVNSETDIVVGGISTKRIAGTIISEGPGPDKGTEEIYVIFFTNNTLYKLIYYKNTEHDYSVIFDQILSTFQFTE